MTKAATQAITEQNPLEVPLYTLRDVARYLRVPVWTALALPGQTSLRVPLDWFVHSRRVPLLTSSDEFRGPEGELRISFRVFADLYLRAVAIHCLAELADAKQGQSDALEPFHEAAWRIIEGRRRKDVCFFGVERPPTEGVTQLLAFTTAGLAEAEQSRLKKRLFLCLERIELLDGQPSRLFPFSRVPPDGSPRTILMDPRVRFGRPTLAGRGLPTDVLFERHQAGDSIAELSQDYDLTTAEVEEAIRYEAMPTVPLFLPLDW